MSLFPGARPKAPLDWDPDCGRGARAIAGGSGHPDLKEPVERQKNRRRICTAAVQMHAHSGAETLDDIVVTFAANTGSSDSDLGLNLGCPSSGGSRVRAMTLGRTSAVQSASLWMICRRVEVTPSAGRTHSPRLDQGPRGDPFVAAVPDLLRIRDCGLGTEKQTQGHRMSAASCMPPVTASTRGS